MIPESDDGLTYQERAKILAEKLRNMRLPKPKEPEPELESLGKSQNGLQEKLRNACFGQKPLEEPEIVFAEGSLGARFQAARKNAADLAWARLLKRTRN